MSASTSASVFIGLLIASIAVIYWLSELADYRGRQGKVWKSTFADGNICGADDTNDQYRF
ncbi:MAG TPA: hypothetical protein HA282_00165 [Nanoarchaeota archaeon]|nr:hypothetical protein [Nanoarchaeota archaeon]HIH51582.1 hypothetical protein [Nanoarchaeota archaeon]HIH65615.1 hypothetical protein [Nanoarchaeota archaeon]